MSTPIIPAKNKSDDVVEDPSAADPETRSATHPVTNAQPCHFVGGPHPKPDGFAGNQ